MGKITTGVGLHIVDPNKLLSLDKHKHTTCIKTSTACKLTKRLATQLTLSSREQKVLRQELYEIFATLASVVIPVYHS